MGPESLPNIITYRQVEEWNDGICGIFFFFGDILHTLDMAMNRLKLDKR